MQHIKERIAEEAEYLKVVRIDSGKAFLGILDVKERGAKGVPTKWRLSVPEYEMPADEALRAEMVSGTHFRAAIREIGGKWLLTGQAAVFKAYRVEGPFEVAGDEPLSRTVTAAAQNALQVFRGWLKHGGVPLEGLAWVGAGEAEEDMEEVDMESDAEGDGTWTKEEEREWDAEQTEEADKQMAKG